MFNKTLFNKTLFNRILVILEDGTIVELLGETNQFNSLTGVLKSIEQLYGSKVLIVLEGQFGPK